MKTRRILAVLAALAACTAFWALPSGATTSTTIQWTGNGSEHADPGCQTGQTAAWHWILTPGGNNELVSGTLSVNYQSGATGSVDGHFQGNGNGAMHFNLTQAGPDVVTSASVSFTYNGDGGNFVLTISDSNCEGTPTPPPPEQCLPPGVPPDCVGIDHEEHVVREFPPALVPATPVTATPRTTG